MRTIIFAALLASAALAQTTYNQGIVMTGPWTPPSKTVSTLPTASTVSGSVYMVTDSSSVGSCSSGSGSNKTFCRSNGTTYDCVGNCSSGGGGGAGVVYCAPASASGTTITCSPSPALGAYAAGVTVALVMDVQGSGGATSLNISGLGTRQVVEYNGTSNPNSLSLPAGKMIYLTDDGTKLRINQGNQCVSGTITFSSTLINNATTQEVTILAAGLPGDFLPSDAWINITTAGTFSSTLTASMGRTGGSTNSEFIPALDAKQVQAWGDKPTPAVFGISNTYTTLVVNFTGGGALGNGATSNVSTGALAWGFCGKRSLQ